MKKWLLGILVLSFLSAKAQKLTFKGHLKGLKEGTKVILTDLRPSEEITHGRFHDTASVIDGSFKFVTKLPAAGGYVLRVGLIGDQQEHRVLYLSAGRCTLEGQRGAVSEAVIKSKAPSMIDFLLFEKVLKSQEVFNREQALTDSMLALCSVGSYLGLTGHDATVQRFFQTTQEAKQTTHRVASQWLDEHPHSAINAWIITSYLFENIKHKDLIPLYTHLTTQAKKSFSGKRIHKMILAGQ